MEGRWGRHIYGRVVSGKGITLFQLESELVAGVVYTVDNICLTKYLEESPDLYARILNSLTEQLEAKIIEGMVRPT